MLKVAIQWIPSTLCEGREIFYHLGWRGTQKAEEVFPPYLDPECRSHGNAGLPSCYALWTCSEGTYQSCRKRLHLPGGAGLPTTCSTGASILSPEWTWCEAFISPDLHLEHSQNIANCYGTFNSNCVHEELPRIFCFSSNILSYILVLVRGSSQYFHSFYLLTFRGPLWTIYWYIMHYY